MARSRRRVIHAVGGKFGLLLVALIALLLSTPLLAEGWVWNLVIGLFASVVLVASLQAARPGPASLWIGMFLALLDLAMGRLVFVEGGRWLVLLQAFLWLTSLAYVTVTILDAVFEKTSVDVESLQAALCVYLLLGLFWVYVFSLIELAAPGSFILRGERQLPWSDNASRRSEFLRFVLLSYSTLTSTRLGELTPATGFAILCACLESLSGHIYLAVVIARLVAMQVGQTIRDRAQDRARSDSTCD